MFAAGVLGGFAAVYWADPSAIVHSLTGSKGADPEPPLKVSAASDSPRGSISTSAVGLSRGASSADGTSLTLEEVLGEKDNYKRAAEDYELVHGLDGDGVQKALDQLATLRQGEQQMELEQLLLKKMAHDDPGKAVAAAMKLPNAHAALTLADPLSKTGLNATRQVPGHGPTICPLG